MQNPIFVFLVLAALLARWIFLPEARAAKPWRAFALGTLLAGTSWAVLDLAWMGALWLAAYALAVALALIIRERAGAEAPGTRLLLLLAHIVLLIALVERFSPFPAPGYFAVEKPRPALAWLIGALFCLKESNFFIRWFFASIKTTSRRPQVNEEQKARAETGNGRVIGSLERLLVYVLLLAGHTFSVPAVIAIKALARFKRMEEDQAFAEYVIIGTFLSILLTLAAIGCAKSLGL